MTARFLLPLAVAASIVFSAAAGAQGTPAGTAATTTEAAAEPAAKPAAKPAKRQVRKKRVVRSAAPARAAATPARFETVRFPDCLFVFCVGRPILLGVAF